jgi:hypothetical protein
VRDSAAAVLESLSLLMPTAAYVRALAQLMAHPQVRGANNPSKSRTRAPGWRVVCFTGAGYIPTWAVLSNWVRRTQAGMQRCAVKLFVAKLDELAQGGAVEPDADSDKAAATVRTTCV